MKKIFKIFGITILVIIIGFIILLIIMSKMQSSPKEYWKDVKTEATMEQSYNRLGSYEVEMKEYDAPKDKRDNNDNHFVVWGPKEKGKYPLIVMVNGTGVPCNKYKSVFEHFASYGYVVIGNDYGTNWDGKHPSETLDFALNNKEIVNKIDKEKIAIGGHSQGGMGAINAVNEYENGKMYKALFALSPTQRELGIALQWGFDLDKNTKYAYKLDNINIPTMLVAGTGKFDSETVSPLSEMEKEFEELNTDVVMFRRSNNVDHGNMLYEVNGYVIAWLDYYVKDKQENEKVFYGDDAEINNNKRYQDVNVKRLTKQ